jgi:hypothetical protein
LTIACIIAPPPDLPKATGRRPVIMHDSVVPPADEILATIPSEFLVPVELDDPSQPFEYDVFIDYDPVTQTGLKIAPTRIDPSTIALDGGIFLVSFQLDPSSSELVSGFCHRIELLVAHAFNPGAPHTPDSRGGDSVTWLYNGGGAGAGCPPYDASALGDGGWMPQDENADGLLVTPESGGGP